MAERPLVVVLGESLLMESIAWSLVDCPHFSVIRFDLHIIDIGEQVKALEPEVVVLELDMLQSSPILSLLKRKPGLLLIAIDLDCSQVIVLHSSQHCTPTMHDLYQIVEAEVGEQTLNSLEDDLLESFAHAHSHSLAASTR